MPDNWDFVLAAYLVWGGTFAVYIGLLVRKRRELERALRQRRRESTVPRASTLLCVIPLHW